MNGVVVFGSINLDVGLRAPRLPQPGETLLAWVAAELAPRKRRRCRKRVLSAVWSVSPAKVAGRRAAGRPAPRCAL